MFAEKMELIETEALMTNKLSHKLKYLVFPIEQISK